MDRDAAPLPFGWIGDERRLVRLDAPDGSSVAWIAPSMGANVVGYAVRGRSGWRHVLFSQGAEQLAQLPSRFGVPILFPFPGHMRRGEYTWQGTTHRVPLANPNAASFTHGFAHQHPWRLEKTGAATARGDFSTDSDLSPAEREGYPFDVALVLDVSLETGALVVTLTAENQSPIEAPVAFGLHPYFGPEILGEDRTRVKVTLPGRAERLLTQNPPVPTGERRGPYGSVQVVPLGQTMLASRTDFDDDNRTAVLEAADGARIILDMDAGYGDVLLFAPDMHNALSLEPHTHAPGAASMPADSPDALQPLELGATLRAAATIRVEGI